MFRGMSCLDYNVWKGAYIGGMTTTTTTTTIKSQLPTAFQHCQYILIGKAFLTIARVTRYWYHVTCQNEYVQPVNIDCVVSTYYYYYIIVFILYGV